MHHKKLIVCLCVAVVLSFTALCLRALFSVSDIVTEYSVYNNSEIALCDGLLEKYNGKSLLFVNAKEITSVINANTNLKVESIEKRYPNTLKISLKERKECYAVKTSDGYVILDEEYCVLANRENAINSVDNLNNVVVEFGNSEFDASKLQIRNKLTIGNETLLNSVLKILDGIESPRDYVTKIRIVEMQKDVNYYAYLSTAEGVEIEIRKINDLPSEKIVAGMNKYFTLSDSERITNKIAVYCLDSGEVTAIYTK